MTIVEVVVAMAIFFFVLTALFGLFGVTTNMGLVSNERTMLTNAMSTYMEEIRAMPYESVGIDDASADVYGSLLAERVLPPEGGYTIRIATTVAWVDDPNIPGPANYKQITLSATAERGGTVVYTSEMSTYVRQDAPAGDYQPPVIAFGHLSPPLSSPPPVISGVVQVDAQASTEMPGARLVTMSFQVKGESTFYLRGQSGELAVWDIGETTAYRSFWWNTLAVDEEGERLVRDGRFTIMVEVVDTFQRNVYQLREVIIDNDNPDDPGVPEPNVTVSGVKVPITWETSMDGRSQTDHYVLEVFRQLVDGGWEGYNGLEDAEVLALSSAGLFDLDTAPFSRYSVRVAGESASGVNRSLFVPSYDEPPVFFVTRPLIAGQYRAEHLQQGDPRGWHVDVVIKPGQPTFPVSSIRHELWELPPGGTWRQAISHGATTPIQVDAEGVFVYKFVEAGNATQPNISRRFKVRTFYRLPGADELTEIVHESNMLGPVGKTDAGTWITFPSPGVW